ncbi:NAD(+) diphosphatase [Utexia brackfieldae]|uniref:NAD(+) diphosphatase n=1 Tax=Utexia brackfieldae TaxID=3074108 RepID=UPI00370DBE4B
MQIAQKQLSGEESGYWFICHQGRLWLPEQGEVPCGQANALGLQGRTAQQIGEWQGQTAWLICAEMPTEMYSLKLLLSTVETGFFELAGRAVQLAEFYRSHHYCGYCGQLMKASKTEWCCLCDHCRQRYYPQIAPSIIVAIRHQNKILLANHSRHKQEHLYTVLAGFVEVGETIEQAVHREVFEETGIKIKHLRYVASQPWPFPNSMMLAYLADYADGTITVDRHELAEADWFHYDNLPKLPSYGTIARRLIEDTVVLCRQYDEAQDTQ